jgi:hypothetical protein
VDRQELHFTASEICLAPSTAGFPLRTPDERTIERYVTDIELMTLVFFIESPDVFAGHKARTSKNRKVVVAHPYWNAFFDPCGTLAYMSIIRNVGGGLHRDTLA